MKWSQKTHITLAEMFSTVTRRDQSHIPSAKNSDTEMYTNKKLGDVYLHISTKCIHCRCIKFFVGINT